MDTNSTQQIAGALESGAQSILMEFNQKEQMIVMCEEMSELTQVLCRRLNNKSVSDEQLIDEVADVLVMVFQMRQIFGPSQVDNRILFKLNRMMERIRNQNKAPLVDEKEMMQ